MHIASFSLKNGQQRDCKILDEGFQREKKILKTQNKNKQKKGTQKTHRQYKELEK